MDVFGRLEIEDSRDANYPLSAAIPAELPGIDYRYWNDTQWWGNQGSRPWCVAFAWLHWAEDGPVTHKTKVIPVLDPGLVYHTAQQLDQWPGENYDGTSVRAGAKVLREKGLIASFHWSTDVATIVRAILTTGPVVVGTNWYEGMSRPASSRHGKPVLKPTGQLRGGHAYVLNGANTEKELFRVKNSWGRNWGAKGRALISFADMQTLLDQRGEACMAKEIRTGS
jgi:hypothetical protein